MLVFNNGVCYLRPPLEPPPENPPPLELPPENPLPRLTDGVLKLLELLLGVLRLTDVLLLGVEFCLLLEVELL